MNYMDDEQKKNQQGSGVNISGGAPTNFATGIPGQEAGAGAKDKKSSGQYANIQSYLDANKDQADQMGSTIAGNVTQKADDATSKIQGFESKAPEVKAYDPNEAYQNLGKLSDEQKNNYRTQKTTGGYSGPQTVDQVEGYADTQKAANEASALVKNAGSESGQQALLKDTYKRPNYSAGENRLDQVLLQNSAGSKNAMQNLSQKYSGLSGMFDQANQKVGTAVNNAQTQALKNKENIVNAEKSQWDNLVNPIQARASQMNTDNQALIGRVTGDINDDILNQETLDRLGIGDGQSLYDLNLSNYLNLDQSQVGLDQAANADERFRYQALADLVSDPTRTQISKDGKGVNPVSFNKEKFDKDYSSRQNEYNSQSQPLAQEQVDLNNETSRLISEIESGFDGKSYQQAIDLRNQGGYSDQRLDRIDQIKARLGQIDQINGQLNSQYNPNRKIKKG